MATAEREALDRAIADALPLAGGRVLVRLRQLRTELDQVDGLRASQRARARDPHAHACFACSPDGVLPGWGCDCCRGTGMDQTPCQEVGHEPQCPHGCCGGPRRRPDEAFPSAFVVRDREGPAPVVQAHLDRVRPARPAPAAPLVEVHVDRPRPGMSS
jgi:hypothetical protein